ncbi:MAG: hypothetical protein OEZ06_05610 [Myxococcales bacterium]|nr:hypothetical protein [Myxococcales bacterium]
MFGSRFSYFMLGLAAFTCSCSSGSKSDSMAGSGGGGGNSGAEAQGGSGGGGQGGSAVVELPKALSCADLDCQAPATCTPGSADIDASCDCPAGYTLDGAGNGCDDVDECADAMLNDCHAQASCENSEGGFSCSCNDGYGGDGVECTDIDECQDSALFDCSAMGTSCMNTDGAYDCVCAPSHIPAADGDGCHCDLSGTFVMQVVAELQWPAVAGVEAGTGTAVSWALRRQSYVDGVLTTEAIACGGTAPDVCSPTYDQAYNQYVADASWDLATMPIQITNLNIARPLPSDAFVVPDSALLLGIELPDPLGTWPADRGAVDGSSIKWVDHDNDGELGVTSISFDSSYGDSPDCPRTGSGGPWPYDYFPGWDSGLRQVKRFHLASRAVSGLSGTIATCDRIEGDVTGPDNGQMKSDGRVAGCVRVEGSGEIACEDGLIDFFDSAEAIQKVTAASFVIKRVADNATCATARAESYD